MFGNAPDRTQRIRIQVVDQHQAEESMFVRQNIWLNIPMVKVRLFRNIHFRGCIHIGPSGRTSFCIHSSKDHPCSGIQVCYPPEHHIPNPNKYVQMNCTPDPRLHTQPDVLHIHLLQYTRFPSEPCRSFYKSNLLCIHDSGKLVCF